MSSTKLHAIPGSLCMLAIAGCQYKGARAAEPSLTATRVNEGGLPALEFMHVPPFGSSDSLQGRAVNTNPDETRVAVLIYVPGLGWYTKPTAAEPLTPIQADGTWVTDITTGGIDERATKIAAYLVPATYASPPALGAAELPAQLEKRAMARLVVTRSDPNQRVITFSGYEWIVKSAPVPHGPGPNYFSDTEENVWVDAKGRLHLRITDRDGRWECCEVILTRSLGFGTYRFLIESAVGDLDPNVVLGLFTWSDQPAYAHREIDIEFSKWGKPENREAAQFVVQPHDRPGHMRRFALPSGLNASTHLFRWDAAAVRFRSVRGREATSTSQAVIKEWTYSGGVPRPGDESPRINVWLYRGGRPLNGEEAEVVIAEFRFVPPADAPTPGPAPQRRPHSSR